MIKKLKSLFAPIQVKLSVIFVAAGALIFIVNLFMMLGIDRMSSEMDSAYRDNLQLNELSEALSLVQSSMTEYLTTKTSDSLEAYYKNEQNYSNMINEIDAGVTDDYYDRMERNIKYMSERYLETTGGAIEAKRGRNVAKYSEKYDDAVELYQYINTYITSLNNEQFKGNSVNYEQMSSAFHIFEIVSMGVLIFAMVISILIVILFTGTIIMPLKTLSKAADEVANGNLEIETLDVTSDDEIGVVTNAFNKMVVSIRQYITQITESMQHEREMKEKELRNEAILKDTQLKYLQAQINPHFLFNTLNAGAQLAMLEDAEKTYDYIQNTAEFFRYNVRKGETDASLEEEIALIDHYLYILNVRFSGEIGYEKLIEADIKNVRMPSMILQPIVENSVNHGIKEMEGKGKITLSVYREGSDTCVCIEDNGVGMDEETIDKILKGELMEEDKPSGSNGIGMDNVISRLKLFMNREDAVTITSEGEGKGTKVLLRLNSGDENV